MKVRESAEQDGVFRRLVLSNQQSTTQRNSVQKQQSSPRLLHNLLNNLLMNQLLHFRLTLFPLDKSK